MYVGGSGYPQRDWFLKKRKTRSTNAAPFSTEKGDGERNKFGARFQEPLHSIDMPLSDAVSPMEVSESKRVSLPRLAFPSSGSVSARDSKEDEGLYEKAAEEQDGHFVLDSGRPATTRTGRGGHSSRSKKRSSSTRLYDVLSLNGSSTLSLQSVTTSASSAASEPRPSTDLIQALAKLHRENNLQYLSRNPNIR